MKVTANVILRDPKTGAVTVINAGEEVPDWAEPRIGDHLKGDEKKPSTSRKSRAKAAQDEASTDEDN